MVDWEKPSPELTRVLEEAAGPFAAIERRKMFGCPAYYINGNMLAGVYGQQLFLRLSPEDRGHLVEDHAAEPFSPNGRAMKEYYQIPGGILGDQAAMDEWMRRSVEFTSSLPPKRPKPKKSGKTAGAGGAGSGAAARRAAKNDPKGL